MDIREHKVTGVVLLDPACGTQRVLDLITDKWVVLLMCALRQRGTTRYNQLHRDVAGITHKMLAQTLRTMERDGIVARVAYPVVPPKVEYQLTPLGESLHTSFGVLIAWAQQHINDVECARDRYDHREHRTDTSTTPT